MMVVNKDIKNNIASHGGRNARPIKASDHGRLRATVDKVSNVVADVSVSPSVKIKRRVVNRSCASSHWESSPKEESLVRSRRGVGRASRDWSRRRRWW